MGKIRVIFGIIVALSAIMTSAAPAFAEFEATKELKGPAKTGKSVLEGGGMTLTCGSAEGEWKLESKKSTTEKLVLSKWNECKLETVGGLKIRATVAQCEYEFKSVSSGITKEAEVTLAGLPNGCIVVKVLLCEAYL
ncbi:MAG TPA: hypothetical protein VGX16_01625, partial [Solirubrobacteraceae bacterium]|nr:hypothetical protein [Solirubrobacteraceae bacterium]